MNEYKIALIATQSDELRDALQALLESVTYIHTIYQASNVTTASEIITTHQPVLVLVEFELLDAITKQSPQSILVALVDSREEQDYAHAKGARCVFMKGTSVSQLVSTIESLLTRDKSQDVDGGDV